MKGLNGIVFIFLMLTACDSENAWDCAQTSGPIISQSIEVPDFDKISVLQRSQLVIRQGAKNVIIETGENLWEDVAVFVENGTLIIDNKNACNLIRDYGVTKVTVTTPVLAEIRNASGLTVIGDGTLSFSELTLRSEDLDEEDLYRKVGDFDLTLDVDLLNIITNGKSNFFLDGRVDEMDINFLDGDNRCECDSLLLNRATIFHRGTNDIFIAPIQEVTGELRSTGNLVLSSRPISVDVQELYKGRVIYND